MFDRLTSQKLVFHDDPLIYMSVSVMWENVCSSHGYTVTWKSSLMYFIFWLVLKNKWRSAQYNDSNIWTPNLFCVDVSVNTTNYKSSFYI